jgi:hypothetical protein
MIAIALLCRQIIGASYLITSLQRLDHATIITSHGAKNVIENLWQRSSCTNGFFMDHTLQIARLTNNVPNRSMAVATPIDTHPTSTACTITIAQQIVGSRG